MPPPEVEPYGPVVTLPLLWAHHAMRSALFRPLEALVTCGWCGALPGQPCTVAGTTRRATYTHGSRWQQVAALLDAAQPGWWDQMLRGHDTWAEMRR